MCAFQSWLLTVSSYKIINIGIGDCIIDSAMLLQNILFWGYLPSATILLRVASGDKSLVLPRSSVLLFVEALHVALCFVHKLWEALHALVHSLL